MTHLQSSFCLLIQRKSTAKAFWTLFTWAVIIFFTSFQWQNSHPESFWALLVHYITRFVPGSKRGLHHSAVGFSFIVHRSQECVEVFAKWRLRAFDWWYWRLSFNMPTHACSQLQLIVIFESKQTVEPVVVSLRFPHQPSPKQRRGTAASFPWEVLISPEGLLHTQGSVVLSRCLGCSSQGQQRLLAVGSPELAPCNRSPWATPTAGTTCLALPSPCSTAKCPCENSVQEQRCFLVRKSHNSSSGQKGELLSSGRVRSALCSRTWEKSMQALMLSEHVVPSIWREVQFTHYLYPSSFSVLIEQLPICCQAFLNGRQKEPHPHPHAPSSTYKIKCWGTGKNKL